MLLLFSIICGGDAVPVKIDGTVVVKPSEESEWYNRKLIIWSSGHITTTVQERYTQMKMEAENVTDNGFAPELREYLYTPTDNHNV